MGTCPKCKLRIRKNGNHVKLGSTWHHKICPNRPRAAKAAVAKQSYTLDPRSVPVNPRGPTCT
jgi:hypothetical protein